MKKILCLLSTITLTAATVSYVVACPKKSSQNENNQDGEKLPELPNYDLALVDYLKEVSEIINSEIKSASENWFQEVNDDSSYLFIKPKVIKMIDGINEDTATSLKNIFENPKNNDKKVEFLSDFKGLINHQRINESIIKLKWKEKYSILLNNVNENELFSIDEDKLLTNEEGGIKFSETDQGSSNIFKIRNESKESYISINVKFNFILRYSENDTTQSIKEDRTFKDFGFNFISTSNKALTSLINKKVKELKYAFLGANKFNTLIKKTNFVDDDKFITNNKDEVKSLIEEKFSEDGFKKAISDKIKEDTNLNENINIDFSNDPNQKIVELNDENLNADGEYWDYSLKATTNSKFKWKNNDDYSITPNLIKNEELYNYIFKNISIEKTKDNYDKSLYDYVKNNYKTWLADYYASVSNDEESKDIKALKKSTNMGLFNIKGLKLKINNFSVDLNEFYIAVGYQVSDEEITSSDLNENSVIFKSIIANLQKGIESYHKTFGIENTSDEYKIAAFSGEIYDKNLWDSFDLNYISGIYTGKNKGIAMMYWKSVLKKISKVLSLDISNRNDNGIEIQDTARKILLKEGNQTIYNWEFLTETLVSFILKNEINGNHNTNGFYMDTIYYHGDDTSDIRFKLNFLNVTFTTDRIWKLRKSESEMYRDRSIIENTRKK
ncbi:hypothetical protein SGLAD_v1c06390 [Spiroplasma gladiatoris]|uniref:Lipoprotein n=1 Tax=Spiroplasma gladiatoris TaxID=2143 RepID=A0A4P7AJ71_9MOLU|nr:hypothetical protein [Spiroplasma gladiatoris]QBQ07838.1 hypothetical protein SGLAD_v1c06390 [Spiroplasma gladiatoris]